jgi:AcrR family transcriptional regulator
MASSWIKRADADFPVTVETGSEMLDDGNALLALRPRKKANQRAEILRVAAALLRRLGYEKTRMEDIATKANVSTPTVYNYFAGKQDILIELLMQDRRATRGEFERIIENPPKDPIEAFASMIYVNTSDIRTAEDKRFWRELLAAVTRAHDREFDRFEANRSVFKVYLERLLKQFVDCGKLSKSIPVPFAAEMIYAINAYDLRHLTSAESCTPEDIRNLARKQMALLFRSWKDAQSSEQGAGARRPRRGAQPPQIARRKILEKWD